MLGHLGFSYIGLIYLLMLFIPNIIWSKNQPIDYDNTQENKILLLLERVGQVCCTCSVLIFSDFNIVSFSSWSLWLISSFLLMIFYEICWIRYFMNEHTEENFYRSFCRIPVPLASLPVMAFLLLGIYGKVIWLIASAIIIGIGHIGIHIQHVKAIK
ncbi:hypothetical protein KQI38_12315 [Tissierella carlieri]|jgi:hypothetical protein|uniref:Uncharacterized protein n=1 Tax=Tissierella carlieri TaxID=689904 RepID=A0ABT1SAR9_9FIRM|nr:hypothetical protein [Tissierella carlieri]MBU5312820.1 hypothetical protein [Tissierella carlieri]MCQ4923591.1 hypothetical protein [Tissierella carlieri]MDU5080422.1 hypothetical protein [Bacillota bacterium]